MSEKTNYFKVSYVIQDGSHSGAIMNVDDEPHIGDEVTIDGRLFEIVEIMELMPPTDDFGFLHATCRYVGGAN